MFNCHTHVIDKEFGTKRLENTKEYFAGVAWAYVSQQFHLGTICRVILNQLIPDARDTTGQLLDTELPGKLRGVLLSNNFLVVLDDVWAAGDWQRLAHAFPIQDSFSKLLITTRNSQILAELGGGVVSTWEAETLTDPHDWTLLKNKSFFTEETPPDPRMEEVARKMLNHCGGNPLAIVALGGVLATKRTFNEWESVFENLSSHLQGDESYSRVYDVLAMGYYDLHYNMKPCFLHMAHFPEDFAIGVERLNHLLIADGIVSQTQDRIGSKRSLGDIADNFLNQLVQKGMIQLVDFDAYEKINTCRLHDLMRDKCLEIAREENFIQIVDIKPNNASASTASEDDAGNERVRRLTMHVGSETSGRAVLEASSRSVSSLRSLLFISTFPEEDRVEVEETCEWIKEICEQFELLRVLDFEGVVLSGTLPSEVGNLTYLRYLSLRGTNITELPSSIENFRSLLILDLRVRKVRIKLPNVLWKMTSLRYIYFPARVLSQEISYVGDLHNRGYEIVDNSLLILDNLRYLERVDNVDLDRVDDNGLLKLASIRKLSATCNGQKGLESVLKSKSIKQLNLKVDAGLLLGESSMVMSDCDSLRILHIDCNRDNNLVLPIRVNMFPRNLVELGFWYCVIGEDPMLLLEQLPNLEILQFRICYKGKRMGCSSIGFPKVTYLILDGLCNLTNWSVDNGGFPKLQKIGVYNCPLDMFPVFLPKNIEISCTPQLAEKVNAFRVDSKGALINTSGRRPIACATLES